MHSFHYLTTRWPQSCLTSQAQDENRITNIVQPKNASHSRLLAVHRASCHSSQVAHLVKCNE